MNTTRLKTIVIAAAIGLTTACAAWGHPLGNSTISHFNILFVLPDRVEVDVLFDFAEAPAGQLQGEMDTDGDGNIIQTERNAWLDAQVDGWAKQLVLKVDGKRYHMTVPETVINPTTNKPAPVGRAITELPGTIGMPTYQTVVRFVARYAEPLTSGTHTIEYEDKTYRDFPGLRRILLEKLDEITFHDPRPEFYGEHGRDPMDWTQYDPGNLPQEEKATITFEINVHPNDDPSTKPWDNSLGPPQDLLNASSETGKQSWPEQYQSFFEMDRSKQGKYSKQADRIMSLIQQGKWGVATFVLLTVLCFGYGAYHALMPGHAKTVVAAYLISQKGTYWHATLLAIIVTITHTLLVIVVGVVIAMYQEKNQAIGNTIQMWLGLIAGLLVAAMGAVLMFRSMTGRLLHHHHPSDHDHDHAHDETLPWYKKLFTHSHPQVPHPHTHDDTHQYHDHTHEHTHGHGHEHPHGYDPSRELTIKALLTLGITGGIVPCPTATIIMLAGISSGDVTGALYAVAVFSLGLAIALMMVGFLALSSRKFAARVMTDASNEGELSGRGKNLLMRVVPALSGAVVVALGLLIAANYVHTMVKGVPMVTWLG